MGVAAGLGAFIFWGFVPIYFKAVAEADPLEVLAHRIIWSVVLLALGLALAGRWSEIVSTFAAWRRFPVYLASTLLVTINWLVFIWAIFSDQVLQASLGYYINPLVSVCLGMVFLGERLNRVQIVAVGFAVLAVTNLFVALGVLPWISLVLAFSFGFYGLVRKRFGVDPLIGLLVETVFLFPVALGYLLLLMWQGNALFLTGGATMTWLLLASGIVTATPLILFLFAARSLMLATIGLMQYIAPTIQFCLAVALWNEPFTAHHLTTFALIWIGLSLFTGDALIQGRRQRRKRAAAPS